MGKALLFTTILLLIIIVVLGGLFYAGIGEMYDTLSQSEPQIETFSNDSGVWVRINNDSIEEVVFCARYGINLNNCSIKSIRNYINNS